MKKRIVSILLVLCMVMIQLPVISLATQEEGTITGISITVDGVTYTEGNVSIKPDSTVVYTATGTNLNRSIPHRLAHAEGITSVMGYGGGWDVDDTHTVITRDYSDRIIQFAACENFRVYYINESDERIYTDLYLTFDPGSEPAQITDIDLIVDGVTYTEGNVPVDADSEVEFVVHGQNLYKVSDDIIIDTPGVYVYVTRMSLISPTVRSQIGGGSWFEGGKDYPITFTNDAWNTTLVSDITVTFMTEEVGPPEITQVAINVDGVTYTEGNVTVRPNSKVSFTISGLNLTNVNQQQIIDTPLAYLPLHSIPLEEDGTYLYVTYASVFEGGSNYQITYTNDAWGTTIPTGIYVTYLDITDYESRHLALTEDTAVKIALTQDLYVDLNGFDLSGTIITNGYSVYGADSATNEYTCDTMGSFSCVDEEGRPVVPERFCTADDAKRYMTLETETGYTFHRYSLDITHLSLNTKTVSFGYGAQFHGDEMVRDQIQSVGYELWLTEDGKVSHTAEFQNTLTLRLVNFDVVNHGETPVYACVNMTLQDGTVLKSSTVAYSLRQMVELLSDHTEELDSVALQNAAQMIQNHPTMETWQVENILAAVRSA